MSLVFYKKKKKIDQWTKQNTNYTIQDALIIKTSIYCRNATSTNYIKHNSVPTKPAGNSLKKICRTQILLY